MPLGWPARRTGASSSAHPAQRGGRADREHLAHDGGRHPARSRSELSGIRHQPAGRLARPELLSQYQAAFDTRPWLFWWPGLFISRSRCASTSSATVCGTPSIRASAACRARSVRTAARTAHHLAPAPQADRHRRGRRSRRRRRLAGAHRRGRARRVEVTQMMDAIDHARATTDTTITAKFHDRMTPSYASPVVATRILPACTRRMISAASGLGVRPPRLVRRHISGVAPLACAGDELGTPLPEAGVRGRRHPRHGRCES